MNISCRTLWVWWCVVCCWTWCVDACPSECSCKWKSGKKTVECSDRGLILIPMGIDSETQVLDISGNDLQILHHDTFRKASLISLQKMYMRSCRLGQIDKYAFRGLGNLVEIDLSVNLLTHIPSQAFEDIPYLRNISLAHNPIVKVEAFAFRQVPQLSRLDLSHCDLQSIRPKAFDSLDGLETLKLNDNRLQDLPTDTLESLKKLRLVELQGNNWRCDCHLRAIKLWLNKDRHLPYPILCAGGPERLKNLSILDLEPEDFACRPSVKTDLRNVVEATIGSNITLECRIESDPVATVSWYFGSRQMISNETIYNSGNGQRLFISENEDNIYDKRSKLILTNVEESDAGEYHCVAENRAGHDEANFTVNPVMGRSTLAALGGSNVNVITIALGFLIVFMLVVIALLLKRIKYGFYSGGKEDDFEDVKSGGGGGVGVGGGGGSGGKKQHQLEKTSIDTSSQKSHDSEIKSESGKAFTVTSDLSYSRSLSDIGNPQFSNPDLISGAANVRDSACVTPITRPISDYCHNWQKSYAMPSSRAVSATGFNYDLHQYQQQQQQQQQYLQQQQHLLHDRSMPMVVDTMSAGSGSDDVFTHSRMSNDYPPDYGLPILPENEVASQPCAKTLKVWQRGVPVYPPMCSAPAVVPAAAAAAAAMGGPSPPNFQTMPLYVRNSPADHRYQRCGTDV